MADVVVVGAGPVGLTMAIMLAGRGRRVVVVERWPQPYPLPRAVHFDHEVARLLARCGLADDLAEIVQPATGYDWRNAEGRTLLRFDWTGPGPSGWPTATMFAQPDLERILARRAGSMPEISVLRGRAATGVLQDDTGVTVELADGTGVRGHYAVGCDGANSLLAASIGSPVTDLGFSSDWLILDVLPQQPREWTPTNVQICDPARPVSLVCGGPGRRRWEFMRLPGEDLADLDRASTAWRLLEPWRLTEQNATLERRAVYTFRARWSESWRSERVFIAGDASHLMPPFAGQGLGAGIRDAANLCWKLDLALDGRLESAAVERLLDSYSTERIPHLRRAVEMSVALGQIICVTDPAAAAERDNAFFAQGGDGNALEAALPPAVLGPGVLAAGPSNPPAPPVGQLAGQGRVRSGDQIGLLDDVVGTGFLVLCDAASPPPTGAPMRTLLDVLDARLVLLGEPAAQDERRPSRSKGAREVTVIDLDGVHLAQLRRHGLAAMIVRPDCYIYGGVEQPERLPGLLESLLVALGLAGQPPSRARTASAARRPETSAP